MTKVWCGWCYTPVTDEHQCGKQTRPVTGVGYDAEPQTSGSIVAVWYGDYRRQEVWVRSGANIGNWYVLGGEFGRPRTFQDPRNALERIGDLAPPPRPGPNEVPLHPDWSDILDRGPVTVLGAGNGEAYDRGWQAGVAKARAAIDERLEWLETDPEGL